MEQVKYRTGLVLSGGGARGFAHLGVLKALNDSGIYPEVIAGTSAGALVGALYADGHSPDDILRMMNASSSLHYVRPTVPREGLLQISGIEKILRDHLRAKAAVRDRAVAKAADKADKDGDRDADKGREYPALLRSRIQVNLLTIKILEKILNY